MEEEEGGERKGEGGGAKIFQNKGGRRRKFLKIVFIKPPATFVGVNDEDNVPKVLRQLRVP